MKHFGQSRSGQVKPHTKGTHWMGRGYKEFDPSRCVALWGTEMYALDPNDPMNDPTEYNIRRGGIARGVLRVAPGDVTMTGIVDLDHTLAKVNTYQPSPRNAIVHRPLRIVNILLNGIVLARCPR